MPALLSAPADLPTIDPETDATERVIDIARRLTGRRPSPSTVWRWVHRGCRGVRLPAVWIGASWCTTPEAWSWWVGAQTRDALAAVGTEDDDAPAERSAATTAKLRAAGLL